MSRVPNKILLHETDGGHPVLAVDPLGITAQTPQTQSNNYYQQFYQDHAKLMSETQGTGTNYCPLLGGLKPSPLGDGFS
jgi:hypothetical protein